MSVDGEENHQPQPMTARLIVERGPEHVFSSFRETDTTTALIRGLAEYLAQLSIEWPDGNLFRFLEVLEHWSDPEDLASFPSACVHTEIPGEYDSVDLSIRKDTTDEGQMVCVGAELVQAITIDVWCTSAQERMAIVAMLEDALDPVEWMAGFHLQLPFYYNAIATYLATGVNIIDGQEESSKRWKLATITVNATLPKIRLVGVVPKFDPRIQTEVD